MSNNNTLNIMNGQVMFDYYKRHNLDKNGIYIPFNEAMCVGEVTEEVFSPEFIKYCCNAHNVTMEKYNEITLLPLKVLFENKFSKVALWFDDDMFCQINLLTLLAYLNQIDYSGNTTFNLINHEFEVINSIELDIQEYNKLYKEVMVSRRLLRHIKLPLMENGIKLYFEYLKEENEITSYIRKRYDLQMGILVQELLEAFPQYGLGDTQYIQLITKCKNYH